MRVKIAGVSGENDNGRRVMEFYAERGLCIGNMYSKYTGVARGQDRMGVKSMIDLVLVKKDMLRYMWDKRVVKGMVQAFQITM